MAVVYRFPLKGCFYCCQSSLIACETGLVNRIGLCVALSITHWSIVYWRLQTRCLCVLAMFVCLLSALSSSVPMILIPANTRCAQSGNHWSALTLLAPHWSMVTTLSLAIDTCRDWTLSNIPLSSQKHCPAELGYRLFWLTRGPFDPLWLSWHPRVTGKSNVRHSQRLKLQTLGSSSWKQISTSH